MDRQLHPIKKGLTPRLRILLDPVARRLIARDCQRSRTRLFLFAGLLALPLLALAALYPQWASLLLVSMALGGIALIILSWLKERSVDYDYLAAARAIEKEHPELNQALITAVESELSGKSSFLGRRVVEDALAHPSRKNWAEAATRSETRSRIQYSSALASFFVLMLAAYYIAQQETALTPGQPGIDLADRTLTVEPGNTEIERGSSQVVIARFTGSPPDEAFIEFSPSPNSSDSSAKMVKSLSDPVFAFTLSSVEQSTEYRIRYGEQTSQTYSLSVYDLPQLTKADASLSFPEYTGWPDRDVPDTLRVSAIEGTQLQYRFNTNKPVASAVLEDETGERFPLLPSNEASTQFVYEKKIQSSLRFTLHLDDLDGRSNALPPRIQIQAIANQRPTLRVDTPRGDQRYSPIEEIVFSGEASDDFGLLDYGIGLVYSSDRPIETSLQKESEAEENALSAQLRHQVALERKSLQPRDSFSWYLWAKDFGPDGEIRHTTGDLYFADIRPFDEIFREQDPGGGGQGGMGGQGMELIEKQRQITISLFRIKNTETPPESRIEDLVTLQHSQLEAYSELQQMHQMLENPSDKQIASDALRFMEGVELSLTQAIDDSTDQPLPAAWSDAQSAYQELIKLNDSEFNVARSQNQSGGGGSASRSQRQIDELDFRNEENRYETATQAQSLASPEERQNLELIAKLNELSRRQGDLNERIQEMQAAIANATTEEERREAERELKRLEEEQRQLVQNADEAIQQAANRQGARQAREQLQEARERMQQSAEDLQQGDVSQALAAGSRAEETLERSKEDMRNRSSSAFSEAMREARRQARELAEQQQELQQQVSDFEAEFSRRLDDSEQRDELANRIDKQSDRVEAFLEEMRQVAEGAEFAEPMLYRELYQVLRDSNGAEFEERYTQSEQLLRQGFLQNANREQQGLAEDLERLSDRVSQAAESVLGDESSELAFAEEEIESLQQQLDSERQSSEGQARSQESSSPTASGGQNGNQSIEDRIRSALSEIGNRNQGPLTGSGYEDWIDRLSTVEALIDDPIARARIEEARERAEDARRDFKRHGELPQWEMIQDEIAAPLNDVSVWLRSELNRIENPDALQPIDSDPVPETYEAFVRRYYESLGEQ
ncbi:hypothetical protein [Pelagicoccus sp. SDUM812003]|uniref:hypothetical protein n=1 Tax=Pelagicoccus sp. SDUM812003 TaxID=3041267 RepID=UPI00280CE2DB|nr:hypothetical protein [Pelagicoccus sp. SDUM812003]MDQ8204023.1 hypothetical protein [Pelagicoccus sp. SDUM812003]